MQLYYPRQKWVLLELVQDSQADADLKTQAGRAIRLGARFVESRALEKPVGDLHDAALRPDALTTHAASILGTDYSQAVFAGVWHICVATSNDNRMSADHSAVYRQLLRNIPQFCHLVYDSKFKGA